MGYLNIVDIDDKPWLQQCFNLLLSNYYKQQSPIHTHFGFSKRFKLLIEMIDLLKNYKDLNNATGYMGSVRYYLAKKKFDTLFIKWLSSNRKQVEGLLVQAKQGKLKMPQLPAPFFYPPRSNISNLSSSMTSSSIVNYGMSNTITPPRKASDIAENRKSLNETSNPNLIKSTLMAKTSSISYQDMRVSTEKIPQFYYPNGKPIDRAQENTFQQDIKKTFDKKQQVDMLQLQTLTQKVLTLPVYFAPLIIKKFGKDQKKMTKAQFNTVWKQLSSKQVTKRAFLLLTTDPNKRYITLDNMKELLKIILQKHSGLDFLKQTPEFQQWYSICVINRMFFQANKKKDLRMSYREFKNSKIMKSLYDIEMQSEINLNRDFFCYEDFYVIYIKFWELDTDHDFFLTKQQLSKYCTYTFSRKAIERIFSQVARKFQNPQKMTFGDFVWFIYCSQDKTTEASIEYWFRILDLDSNGIVTGYQLQYFFEEQNQRLASLQNGATDFNYENMICQMVDLIKPKNGLQFTLDDFLNKKKQIGVFINCLVDLDKMQNYDSRDPYEERAEKNEHPDWTDWERFVKPEYKKVEAAEQGGDDQVLNWENDQ